MSTNSQDQEIDLGQIGRAIKNFFNGVAIGFFNFLLFIKSKIVIIAILFIVGVALAFLVDKKTYNHEVAVVPNFDSNEYLYKVIEQVDTKLRENDTAFFNKIGIKNYKDIVFIKIEAYPGIYNFVNNPNEENNFELIKLMAEDGSLDKILKDEVTSKNYYHHKISIQTKGMFQKDALITPLLRYLNSNSFFKNQQKISYDNLVTKITFNDSLSSQIDRLMALLATTSSNGTLSISEKNSIPELVEKKDKLLSENQYLLRKKSIYENIITEESSVINIRYYKPLLLNSKIVFPIFLILIYFLMYSFASFYKKQNARTQY